ncbi:MAG: matrixin family metalloprotease [Planctomycetes bacterium]|nr:matrixin family metalloprotease [Planctomycetota bacterium]
MRKVFAVCSVWACLLWCITPTWGAVEYRAVADLTVQAEQIVIGDVVEINTYWDGDVGLIKSHIVVAVSDYLVGTGDGLEEFVMSGGTVGDVTLHVSVLPVFEVEDHVLLFLGNSEIRLVESFQGAYLTDGTLIARTAPGCGRIIEDSIEPLTDFLAKVEQALPPGTVLPKVSQYQGSFELPPGGARYGLCGYDWSYKSNPMGEDIRINPNCVDGAAGTATEQETQILNGPGAWNNAGADFEFTYGGTTTQTSISYNGTNLIYFDTTPPDGGSYVAANYIWASSGDISENDIVFNDRDYTWWNGSGSCSNMMDIWNIATHENGHSLCLADLYNGGDSGKTMYGYVSYCETGKRTLHSDDIAGIVAIYGGSAPDTNPPVPNPMTFDAPPYPMSIASIGMAATIAYDAESPPVQYEFDFVSGGSGGTDSGWQSSTGYTDYGLDTNTEYTYRVRARDSASTPNVTSYSGSSTTATLIETPSGIGFGTTTTSSIGLYVIGSLSYLGAGSSGVYFDSTTSGGDGGINNWIQTTTDTATGLSPNTEYTFRVKARNRNAVETGYCPTDSKVTLANVPTAPSLSNATNNSLDLNVNANGNPSYTDFAVRCTGTDPYDAAWDGQYVNASGNPSGSALWQTDSAWGTTTVQGLQSNTEYTFAVKAKNTADVETAFGSEASLTTTGGGWAPGDANCDGAINGFDIDPFVMILGGTPPYTDYYNMYPNCDHMTADVNEDGQINGFDIDAFVNLLS